MNKTRLARILWGCFLLVLTISITSCQPILLIQISGPDIPFDKPAIGFPGWPTPTPAPVVEVEVTEPEIVAASAEDPSPVSTPTPQESGLSIAEALTCLEQKSTVYGIALANSNVRAEPEVDGCYMGRVPRERIVRITQAYAQGSQQPYHETIQTTTATEVAEPAPSTSSIGYIEDIQPIFQDSCGVCHGGEPQSGGLKATEYEPLMAGGKSGRVVIPGDSNRSLLWYQISLGIMPMTGPLPDEDQQLIKAWIDAGAPERRVAPQPSTQQIDNPSPSNPVPENLWWSLIRDDVDLVQNSCESYIEDPKTLVTSGLIAPIGCNTVPSRSTIEQIAVEYQVELSVAEAATSTPTLVPTSEIIETPVLVAAVTPTPPPPPPPPTAALFPTPLPAPAVDVLFPTFTPLPVPLFTPLPIVEQPTSVPPPIFTFTPIPTNTSIPTSTPIPATPIAVAIVSGQSDAATATAIATSTPTPNSTTTSTSTATQPLPTAVPPTSTQTPTPTITPTSAPSATPTLSTTEANIRVSPLGLAPPSDGDPWLIPQGGYCIEQRLPRNERSITALAFTPDGRLFMALDSSPANEPDPFILYDAYHPSRSIAVYDTVNDSGFGEILTESTRVTGLDYYNGALYVSRAGEVGYIPDGGQYQALAGGFAVDGRLFHANNGLTILNGWLYISAGGLMDGYTDGPIVGMTEQQAQVTVAKGNRYASRLVRAPVDRLVSERSINVFQTAARGLRNPYGLTSDVYGRLWITDNGATNVPNTISAGDEVSMFDPRMLSADAIAGNEEATPYYGFPLALNGAPPSWYTGPIVDLPNASAPTGVTWAYDTVFFGVYGTKPGLYRMARAADGRMIAERIMLVWPLISVTTAPDGSLWIGTGEGGLYRMTPGC